jgi:hypothetical protein
LYSSSSNVLGRIPPNLPKSVHLIFWFGIYAFFMYFMTYFLLFLRESHFQIWSFQTLATWWGTILL